MPSINRRFFLRASAHAAAVGLVPFGSTVSRCLAAPLCDLPSSKMQFGLVTYKWGDEWDIPTLLRNCEKTGALGVELRTQHAHGVDPGISSIKRQEVKLKFSDSPITLVGLGSNECFHHIDPQLLKASIARAKEFIKLSYDVGGGGVKVKPNNLPEGVPREKTIEQIGNALNELAFYAADYGQQVRLEVHGKCAPLPIIASIMEVADHPGVAVCWNSNKQDLQGEGLEHNFALVQKRLGATTHVRQLDGDEYPNAKLIELLKGVDYKGWLLIEDGVKPDDKVAALSEQRKAFDRLIGS